MPRRKDAGFVDKSVDIEADLWDLLTRTAERKGMTKTALLNAAIREYLTRDEQGLQANLILPAVQETVEKVLQSQLGYVETWLRPGVYSARLNAGAAMLLLLELLAGHRIAPEHLQEHLETSYRRAAKLMRKESLDEMMATAKG